MRWWLPEMLYPCRMTSSFGWRLWGVLVLYVVCDAEPSAPKVSCPEGWSSEEGRCFRLFVSAQDFETARQNCGRQQASLANVYPNFGNYARKLFGSSSPQLAWVRSSHRATAKLIAKRDTEPRCTAVELSDVAFTILHRDCAERLPYLCEKTQIETDSSLTSGYGSQNAKPDIPPRDTKPGIVRAQQNSEVADSRPRAHEIHKRIRRDVSTNVTELLNDLSAVDAAINNSQLPAGIQDRSSYAKEVLKEIESLLSEATPDEAARLVSSLSILGSILVRTLNSTQEESFTSSSMKLSVRLVDPTDHKGFMFHYHHITDQGESEIWFPASVSFDAATHGVILYEAYPANSEDVVNLPQQNESATIMSTLIAAIFVDANGNHVTATGDVTISQHNHARPQFSLPSCVSMTFNQRLYDGWRSSSCSVNDFSAHRTMCTCKQGGAFAVAMVEQATMGFLAWAGCAITTVTSIITLMTLIGYRLITTMRSYIRASFLVALASAEAIFFTGLNWSDVSGLCTMIAIALQFCVIATFAWLLCYVLYLGSEMREASEETKIGSTLYNMMGWLAPLSITLISVIWARTDYRDILYCWMSGAASTLIAGFFAPMGLFILLTLIVLIFDIKVYLENKDPKRRYHWAVTWSGIRTVMLLLPLLTATWVLGAIAVVFRGTVTQIIFAICNAFLGILIFVSMCWLNEEIRVARKAKKIVPVDAPIKKSDPPKEKSSGVNIVQPPIKKASKHSLAAIFSAPSRIEPTDDAACIPLEQVGDSGTEVESDGRGSENETTRLAENAERPGRSSPPEAESEVTSGSRINVQPSRSQEEAESSA